MAKTKISEFSSTAADNTDVTNINIAEGCSPANVNNAIRSLMALLKDQQTGASGDPFTVAGTLVASGQALSSGTLNVTGAFQLDGTAGASGQALVSAGGANTPTWSTLGTMASQSASAVSITGGTITGITDLTVADGGTGASSITANSVILGNGTSALSGNLVAPSTSGNVLTSNGTTWQSSAIPQPTITRGTVVNSTSGTSINFTGIPSWVKRVTVMFNGVSTTGTSPTMIQLGTGGSPETSGYVGTSARYSNGNTTSVGSVETSGFDTLEGATADSFYGTWVFTNITSNTWVCSATISRASSVMVVITGSKSLSGTLNMIRVTTVSGTPTFDAGSINILYE